MRSRCLVPFLLAGALHAQSGAPVHRSVPARETASTTQAGDTAIRKLAETADAGFAPLRGDYHGPGLRWESNFKIPGALFCNVDWRKQDDNSVGEFYCDMGEHYTYLSAAEAMNRFSDPVRHVLPTWRGIVKSDGNHPDFSDSDVRMFMAPHLKGERSPSINFERIKSGDEYMVVFFFDSVMSSDELVAKYGGPAANEVKTVEYDYGRLVNDLIEAQSKTWMMNRFTSGSAIVTALSKGADGQTVQVKARYDFVGMNGAATGTVVLMLPDGVPQCLYFFDFPQICKPVDSDIKQAFGNNEYLGTSALRGNAHMTGDAHKSTSESAPPLRTKVTGNQGFALQAGLWKLTTIVHPHAVAEDKTGVTGALFKSTKVSNLCLSGKPGDVLINANGGQQGCTVTKYATSATSTNTDLTCTTTMLGSKVQMIMHSEMTLSDDTHARADLRTTTKGIGNDSVMDGLQIWTFLGKDCGDLTPGQSEAQ